MRRRRRCIEELEVVGKDCCECFGECFEFVFFWGGMSRERGTPRWFGEVLFVVFLDELEDTVI